VLPVTIPAAAKLVVAVMLFAVLLATVNVLPRAGPLVTRTVAFSNASPVVGSAKAPVNAVSVIVVPATFVA
jgi:hypothetical protein